MRVRAKKVRKIRPLYMQPLTYAQKALHARMLMMTCLIVLAGLQVLAQSGGAAGLQAAYDEVTSYFDAAVNVMYGVGALLGLVGAIRVFQKWSNGDQDTGKVASAWFGSCIFLIIVATVLRGFFL